MGRIAHCTTMSLLVVLIAGCDAATPVQPDGLTGELIITRQRDLIDRGLINVLTQNDSETSLLLSDIELVAENFDGEPASERTISVRSGGRVAIQVPYGTVDDCDITRAVDASLIFTYTSAGDASPRSARIDLDGTDLLDSISAEQCASRRLDQNARTYFEGTVIVDGVVATRLVIEPTGTAVGLEVTAVSGTILVRADTAAGWSGGELSDEAAVIPLTFTVNRCDPHAVAEVTKRFGLDIDVSVDGAAPVPVPIDISAMTDELEAIVEQCQTALPDE